jgi:hypothetical protein
MRFLSAQSVLATVAVVGVVGFSYSFLLSGPCERPLAYRVGTLDERFGISTSTAQSLLLEAEAVWEQEVERELFVYDPEADFTVNFIFDERQETTNTVNEYESILSDLELSHTEIAELYEERKDRYEAAVEAYRQKHDVYEADLRDYNRRVSEWNERGGAPPAVYAELQAERRALDVRLADLQNEQKEVESLRLTVNNLVTEGNSLAHQHNQTASTFTDRFGGTRKFDQATYERDQINIYQFKGPDDLRLALAHEFGHALGIEHVTDSRSIMYYLMEDQSIGNLALSEEDISAFKTICNYE